MRWQYAYVDMTRVDRQVSDDAQRELDIYLDAGWEPFAVTVRDREYGGMLHTERIHLRFQLDQ